jgi:hypothetical protein
MEKEVMLKDKRGHTFIWFIFPDRKFVLSNDLGNDKCILNIQPNQQATVLRQFAVEGKWSKAFDSVKKGGMFMY